jgi:hypothetical protein
MTLGGYKGLHKIRYSALFYTISLGHVRIGSSHLDVDSFNMLMIWWCIWHTDCVVTNVARGLVQTACTLLNVFFSSMGLTISASESEVMLFTRLHEHHRYW